MDDTPIDAAPPEAKPAPKPRIVKPPAKKPGLKPRLSIPLDPETGRAAVEAMSDDVRERYFRAVGPVAAAPAAPGQAAADAWDTGVIDFLYDSIAQVCVLVAQRRGYTAEQAAVLGFTVQDKAQLREPTQHVLDKYFPGGLGRWGDEVMLAVTLLAVGQQKLVALRAVAPAGPAGDTTAKAPAAVLPFSSQAQSTGESQ